MEQIISVLIVEDHPLTSMAYKSGFDRVSSNNKEITFDITIVDDCDSANEEILKAENGEKIIDLVFLDINLKPSKNKIILSGEDLGVKIRRVLPNAKIAICTTHFDSFRIQNIIENLDPEGFLVKNDFNAKELIYAIKKIISSPPYYSTTVLKSFRQKVSNSHSLDGIDRKLLYELSIGTKMNELPTILPLSMAGIEKRKRKLMDIFALKNKNDRDLILIAKEKGFI